MQPTLTPEAKINNSLFLIKPTDCLCTYSKMYMDQAYWITNNSTPNKQSDPKNIIKIECSTIPISTWEEV